MGSGAPSVVTMSTQRPLAAALAAALVTSALAGCSASAEQKQSGATKRTSFTGDSVTLTIGTDETPGVPSADQVSHFVEQVADLSDGKITIEPRWDAEGEGHAKDWDQAVAARVQAGELDLGLGTTWGWDVLGVTSLQPLQAPFLVDSDELVAEVVGDEQLAVRLMSGVADLGLVGVSMWPEGLRHPFGFDAPLTRAGDYDGQVVRSPLSSTISDVFSALGASTSAAEPNAETMAGLQGEFRLQPSGTATGNVTFFPKVNMLYANAETYAGLDDEVVEVLTAAAGATQEWAVDNASDLEAAATFCADGGTIIDAGEEDVRELVSRTAPVVDAIGRAPGNRASLDAIAQLKEAVGPARTAAPCVGEVLERHDPGKAEAALNGTYRFTLTVDDFARAGRPAGQAESNAGTQTFTLEDGEVHVRLDPTEHQFGKDPGGADEADGTYQVDGTAITFWFPVYAETDRMFFEVGKDGDLTMTPLDFPDTNVEFLMTTKTWERLG